MGIEAEYQKPSEVDVLVRALLKDGFKEDKAATTKRQEWSDDPKTGGGSMSAPGPSYRGGDSVHPYRVLHTLAKGDVHVVIEQNTAHEPSINGVITYEPVAFVTLGGQDHETEERFSIHPVHDIEGVLEHVDMCAEGVVTRAPHETKYQRVTGAHQPQFDKK